MVWLAPTKKDLQEEFGKTPGPIRNLQEGARPSHHKPTAARRSRQPAGDGDECFAQMLLLEFGPKRPTRNSEKAEELPATFRM